MEEGHDALVDLRAMIEKQMALQSEANDIMRALIGALQENSQATADLMQQLAKMTVVLSDLADLSNF